MVITTTLCALALTLSLGEEEYYEIATIPIPDDIVLEVSGIEVLEDGTALVATRRGNVYRVTGAWDDDVSDAQFHLYAQGLQEPLGLLNHEGWSTSCSAESSHACATRAATGASTSSRRSAT